MVHGHDYSVYTGSSAGRTGTYALLAVVSAFLASLLHQVGIELAKRLLGENSDLTGVAFFLGSVGGLAIFGFLVWLFDIWLWKTVIGDVVFALSKGTKPPVISGLYEGTVTWFDLKPRPNSAATGTSTTRVRIVQRWERLAIFFDHLGPLGERRAGSHSDMASIHVGMGSQDVRVHYTYSYEGTWDNPEGRGVTTQIIHGTSMMTFTKKGTGWLVQGTYYSDDGGSGQIRLEQNAVPGTLGEPK